MDPLPALGQAVESSFSTLVSSTTNQISEIKSMCGLRGAAGGGSADLKAISQRLTSAEASLLELTGFVAGEEENIESLKVWQGASRTLRVSTDFFCLSLVPNLVLLLLQHFAAFASLPAVSWFLRHNYMNIQSAKSSLTSTLHVLTTDPSLQALVEQARELRDATAYMKTHIPFNLPSAIAAGKSRRA